MAFANSSSAVPENAIRDNINVHEDKNMKMNSHKKVGSTVSISVLTLKTPVTTKAEFVCKHC